jgi:two-component system, OmpR family, response regulator BaeR
MTAPLWIVEDDAHIADMLDNYLQAQGFATRIFGNGQQALSCLQADPSSAQLLLLDVMLPGLDGMQVCRQLRAFSAVPVIMLTARIDEIDRLLGLELGADDYICKPFSPREVVARIKALLRRASPSTLLTAPGASALAGFAVDEAGQRGLYQGQSLKLTPVEFRLFNTLMGRPGHVFSRARLLDGLHDDWRDVSDRAIDTHIKNLRRKMEQVQAHAAEGVGISSVYGVGYRLDVPAPGGQRMGPSAWALKPAGSPAP